MRSGIGAVVISLGPGSAGRYVVPMNIVFEGAPGAGGALGRVPSPLPGTVDLLSDSGDLLPRPLQVLFGHPGANFVDVESTTR